VYPVAAVSLPAQLRQRASRLLAALEAAPGNARLWNLASAALLVSVLGVMLATFLDYGITCDEGGLNRYGRRLVQWYTTLGQDDRAVYWADHYFYGGFFEITNQVIQSLLPLDVYQTRHLTGALFGFVGFVAAWGLGSRLAGSFGGFLSALFLVLTPSFYGHAFANPKDVPLASLYALGAWAALRASDSPRLGWREGVLTGAAIGLASGVRVAAIVLYGYAAVLWLACLWLRARTVEGADDGWRSVRQVGLAIVTAVVTGWAVMIAFWPFAQVKPFRNPFRAWQKFSYFWDTVTILYDGQLLIARDGPRWYVPNLFSLTLPEFYPLAGLLGGVGLLALLRRRASWSPTTSKRILQALWVLSLAVAPVAWVVIRHTPFYNGTRHMLFVVPPLAVVAGVSAAVFLRRPEWRPARALAAAALAVLLLVTAVDMVQLHPYQYVYYNRLFAGGVRGAAGRYELDYWGSSFKEGIEWMVDHYSRQPPREKIRVAGYSSAHVPFWYYLNKTEEGRRLFEAVTLSENPHVVFATTAIREHEQASGRVLHVVKRQETPLLYIFEARAPE
jgi:hypothetical protein